MTEIKASVLARKSACLHKIEEVRHEFGGKRYLNIKRRSFQEIGEIIWLVLFKQTPDDAKRLHDKSFQDLEALQNESMFTQELPDEILEKKGRLSAACRQYSERSGLVHRAASIVFERAPKRDHDGELEFVSEPKKTKMQKYRERMSIEKKETVLAKERIENLSEDAKENLRERKRKEKAAQRLRAKEKKSQ